jgi:cytochrome c oxidase subunit III
MNDHPVQPPPPMLDVSHLPEGAFDSASPVWWGNTLLIFIETTTIALLLASYFYCWRNLEHWPPPLPNQPSEYDPMPHMAPATTNFILMALSCIPMYLTNKAARALSAKGVRIGLWVMFAISALTIIIRFYEFPALKFRWSDNAYASIVWTITGLHLTYLLAGAGEFLIMGAWVMTHPLDEHHAHDVTLAGAYWYWVAGTWAVIYFVIYLSPRLV